MYDYTKKTTSEGGIDFLALWHKAVLELFDFSGKAVLDIGCGSGSLLYHLKNKAKSVVGIDPNPENTKILSQYGIPAVTGFLEDHKEMFRNKIEVCTCFEVIEHIMSPSPIFRAAWDILPLGGALIVSTPNAFNITRAMDFIFFQEHHDPLMDPTRMETGEHIRGWGYKMLKRAFVKNGFEPVEKRGVAHIFGKLFVFKQPFLVKYFSQNLLFVGRKVA